MNKAKIDDVTIEKLDFFENQLKIQNCLFSSEMGVIVSESETRKPDKLDERLPSKNEMLKREGKPIDPNDNVGDDEPPKRQYARILGVLRVYDSRTGKLEKVIDSLETAVRSISPMGQTPEGESRFLLSLYITRYWEKKKAVSLHTLRTIDFPSMTVRIIPVSYEYERMVIGAHYLEGSLCLIHLSWGDIELFDMDSGSREIIVSHTETWDDVLPSCYKKLETVPWVVIGGHQVNKERTVISIYDYKKRKMVKDKFCVYKNRRSFVQWAGDVVEKGKQNTIDLIQWKDTRHLFRQGYNDRGFLDTFVKGEEEYIVCGCSDGIHILRKDGKMVKKFYDKKVFPDFTKKLDKDVRTPFPSVLHVTNEIFLVDFDTKLHLIDLQTKSSKVLYEDNDKVFVDEDRKANPAGRVYRDRLGGPDTMKWICKGGPEGVYRFVIMGNMYEKEREGFRRKRHFNDESGEDSKAFVFDLKFKD